MARNKQDDDVATFLQSTESGRNALAHWDEWDYKIFGPVSLDDRPVVTIWLINKRLKRSTLKLGPKIILEVNLRNGA